MFKALDSYAYNLISLSWHKDEGAYEEPKHIIYACIEYKHLDIATDTDCIHIHRYTQSYMK